MQMEGEAEYKWMWKVGSEAHLSSLEEVDLAAAGQQMRSLKWPPRSYCCSFCGREFRSAQALGGHMNAHRRDRAKLKHLNKHSPISHNESCNLDHIPIHHCKSRHNLITQVAASSSSPSSSGSGFEGEQVLKKQKLCMDFTIQINTEKEDDQDSDSFKHDLQTEAVDLDLELRL